MAPKRVNKEGESISGSKKARIILEESDDDFVEKVPYRAPVVEEERETSNDEDLDSDDDEKFQSRNNPKLLIDAMTAMNVAQQRAVQEMGFGHLVHLKLDAIPGRLTTWCLDKWDPITCSIEMKDGSRLHMDVEDIFLMFGFPKGPHEIKRVPRIKDKPLVEEWAQRFNRKKNKVLPSQLIAKMLAEEDEGDWFKRDFLILVECCLIENASDGYLKPKVIDVIRDLSKIKQYNWCDHVLNAMHVSHHRWISNKIGNFTGPALFLVLFYADRTIHYKRYVDRAFPLIKGWNADLLRLRQRAELEAGGFGTGFVVERFNPASLFNTKYEDVIKEEEYDVKNVKGKEQEPEVEIDEAIAYTNKMLAAAKLMADSMSTIMNLIKSAPEGIRLNESFKNAVQTCKAVLGHTPKDSASPNSSVNICSQKLKEDEYNTPEWNEAVVKMMEVFEERQRMEEDMDMPSFSMGFTQCPIFNRTPDPVATNEEGVDVGNSDNINIDVEVEVDVEDEHEVQEAEAAGVVDASVLPKNVVPKKEDINVQLVGEEEPSTKDKAPLKDSVMYQSEGRVPISEHNIDVDATLASVMKDIKAAQEEVESSEDDIPIIMIGKKGREKRKGKGKANAMSLQQDKNKDVPSSKASSKPNVQVPSAEDVANEKNKERKGKAPMTEKSKQSHSMDTRTAAERQKAATLLSPFNVRQVSAALRLELLDKQMYYWIIANAAELEETEVFSNKVYMLIGSDFRTFRPNTYLCASLLDAWSMVLNSREADKSADSPSRFFFTSYPCSFTIADTPPKWTIAQVREAFFERVNDELKKTPTPKLDKFDLVFFPIIHKNHFYVMVFNLKDKKLLLDNSNRMDKEHLSLKYGDIPVTLSQMFCDYLESHKMGMKALSMRRVPIDRMKMSWRNSTNKVDCGVYAMRHMETFMGQKVKEWDLGLLKDHSKQLMYLRAKYCRVLLTCEINIHRDRNMAEAKAKFNKTYVRDFDRFIETCGKKQ